MRRRAYARALLAAVVLTLIATTIAPDVNAPILRYPNESASVRDVQRRAFECIAWPPQAVARSLGIWIESHSAQLWPPGWPVFLAFATRLSLISVPFWFVIGLLGYELIRVGKRLLLRVSHKSISSNVVVFALLISLFGRCRSFNCPSTASTENSAYLGGWLLDTDGRYGVHVLCTPTGYRVRLQEIIGYDGNSAKWRIVAELAVPARRGEYIIGGQCHSPHGDVVVLATMHGDSHRPLRAWRPDVQAGGFRSSRQPTSHVNSKTVVSRRHRAA